jgi:predicted DNA-binding protein
MKKLTIRCSDEEHQSLTAYCEETDRTQNDVLRELIRKLKTKRKPS